MKKNTNTIKAFRRLGIGIISVCAAAGLLTGCSVVTGINVNADKYTAGDAEITDKVESIDIEWASGSVDVIEGEGSSVIIDEDSDNLPDDKKVQWWLEGTTLHIRFSKATFFGFESSKKNLIVTVPKGLELKEFSLDGASAKLVVDNVNADSISIESASGGILVGSAAGESIKLDSASGSIDAGKISASSLDVDVASGSVGIRNVSADKIKIDSASGGIELYAIDCTDADIDTASGRIMASFENTPDNLYINSASGSVTVAVPEDSNFTADIDTASGRVNFDIPAKNSNDKYIVGDGSSNISIDTASGSVTVTAVQ